MKDIAQVVDKVNKNLEPIPVAAIQSISKPTKCQAIIVRSQRMMGRLNTASISPIVFNDPVVFFRPIVKDLGLHID